MVFENRGDGVSRGILPIEKNAFFLIVTEVLIRAFGLSLTIVIARILGVGNFGLLNFAYALSGICLLLSDFGFERLTVRELAQKPRRADHFMSHISLIKVALYLIMAGLCAILVLWRPASERKLFVVLIIFIEAAAQQHLLFVCSFFKAAQQMGKEALIRGFLAFLLFLSGIAVLRAGLGLEGFVVSRLMISLFCLALGLFWVKKELNIRWGKVRWRYAGKLMQLSLPLALFQIFVMIYLSIHMVVLGWVKGNTAVGYYSASYKVMILLLVIPNAISWASLPVLSKNWRESFESFRATYQKSVRYLLLLAIPIAVGTFLLAREAVLMIYGMNYLPSAALLSILVLSIVPDYLNHIFAITLISMNRQRAALASAIAGAVVAVLTSVLFIPPWGEKGAAIGLVLAMLSVFLLQFMLVIREFHFVIPWRIGLRTILAGGVMALSIFLLKEMFIMLPVLLVASSVVYVATLFVLREIKPGELKYVCGLLRNFARKERTAP